LHQREVVAETMHWIAGAAPALPRRLAAKTRYRMSDAACELRVRGDGVVARFDEAQWAPTPGQYLVLYEGEHCLGGGVIVAPRVDPAGPPRNRQAVLI
jgi:tRNA-specific 2-thiouridylase